jgi:hypothetical protein
MTAAAAHRVEPQASARDAFELLAWRAERAA